MGAKDVFTNPQFVGSMGSMPPKPVCNEHLCNNEQQRRNNGEEDSIDQEWHQKYAFMIGLLRKPHSVLIKESLGRERNKISQKLHAYRLERDYVKELMNKAKLDLLFSTNRGSTRSSSIERSDEDAQQSLTAQMKHLDMMCVTLERQMDVLGNVDQALPSAENIYSGEPDSLDGTSSEIMMIDDLETSRGHYNRSHSNFQLIVNGRSPLDAFAMLHLERSAHRETRKELNMLRKKYEVLRDEFDSGEGLSHSTSLLFSRINGELEEDEMFSNNLANDDGGTGHSMETDEIDRIAQQVRLKEMTISQLRSTLEQLEKARLDKGPVDSAREIARLHATLVQLERVRDELTLQNFTLKSKLAELSARITDSTTYRLEKHNNNNPIPTPVLIQSNGKNGRGGESNHHQEQQAPDQQADSHQSEPLPPPPPPPMNIMSDSEMRLKRKSTYKVAHHNNNEANAEIKQLRSFINDLHAKEIEYQKKIAQLETDLRNSRNEGIEFPPSHASTETSRSQQQQRQQPATPQQPSPASLLLLQESNALKLDLQKLNAENQRLKDDLSLLHIKVEKEQTESLEKLRGYEKEMGAILEQNKALQEDCTRERCLRKKYFNMVEELKGKIRVFCRIRPPSKTEKAVDVIVRRSDPYTVTVDTPAKGLKEFHFDRVFIPDDGQDQIFEDTKNLIKSAFDGYNVCICAYGQTGSGKTYTILGDELNPGIAPRTFREIFHLAGSLSHTYDTQVSFYALELYNDKLIDLLNPPSSSTVDHPESKLEIRRDRKGIVWVSGARVLSAADSSSLEQYFRQALQSRHTASTKMNDRSSRSHLVVGLIIETTSKVNGTILRGKISLVDLAGSERTAKSGVSANTLREANAINKSLSAFGDVINALTTDQSFVPYRNNKLTLLMQDSIGGNAKTLMFVNISPSSFNMEETIISLSYASRVKQVTNSVTRNSESKEIARLKNIISRLKRGESCTPEEDT